MRNDENLANYLSYSYEDNRKFARVWSKSTIYEKAFFCRCANIFLTIFTDLFEYPKWDEIDDHDQTKIGNAMIEVFGA